MFITKQRKGLFAFILVIAFGYLLPGIKAQGDGGEDEAQPVDLFHKDSDFMRGFETGLFLRSKNGKVEEYGCEVPTDSNKGV